MKAGELRQKTADELKQTHDELKQELFNLRFQHGIGQLENSKKMMLTKKAIARVKTVINEKNKE